MIEYLKPNKNYWVIDIETDDLDATVIWVCCCKNVITKKEVTLIGHNEIKRWFDEQPKNTIYIGHNILGFDVPVLNRLFRTAISVNRIIDTLLLSMLFNPSLKGGHSLDDWGVRLKNSKGNFNDWSKLSDEMISYCMQDVRLTYDVYHALIGRMNKLGYTNTGIELEHRSWFYVKQQQKDGFAFNIEKARELYSKLRIIEDGIKEEIYTFWPPKLEAVREYKNAFKRDGSHNLSYERNLQKFPKLVCNDEGGYTAYDWVEFSIGSPKQRIEKLLEAGWEPKEFTPITKKGGGGNPKVTEKGELTSSLKDFVKTSGRDEVKLIANWITINSRANMINTWIKAYNEHTKCIHGSLWLANTLRYRHSNPNSANIPAVRLDETGNCLLGKEGDFTYEARDLWTVRDTNSRTLVGVDAKGIQLRVLAHYLDNKDFTEAVLDGDPHTYNQGIGGFRTRPIAKTFIYAFLLGAGDAKVGNIIGGTTKEGRNIKSRFVSNFPGLDKLLRDLEKQVERTGRIILCDGTPVKVTAMHTRLGYLLQGDESRIMKKAKILSKQMIRREKLDAIFVGDIHDEWQLDVLNEHVDRLMEIFKTAFKQAGEFFNYKLPIDCDSKKGLTWAETH